MRSVDTAPAALVHAIGSGRVLYLRNTIGRTFYQADAHRKSLLATFRKVLGNVGWKDSDAVVNEASTVSFTVGLTVYEAPSGKRLFVDANNTDIDVASDTVRSSPECTFTVRLPPLLAGRPLQANVLSPDDKSVVKLTPIGVGRARIALGGIRFYAAIVISPK